ncbi:SapC family protein [Sulfurimonas sp.]|uniref:SapC family protein n=1 Tax=Sulfurimonas sp. TaxID=2022749 RepID=UPI003568C74E
MLANVFKKPEILNKSLHRDLKLSQYENYEFAKDAYLVPISIEEMLVAMKSLIIVFVKDENATVLPSVVLGGEESKNLLLLEDNTWKENSYIPAALRCYPFGLGMSDGNNFITIDTQAEALKDEKGKLIVKDEKDLTEEGNFAVKFVTEVYTNINNAKNLGAFIESLGILKQAEINIQINEEKYSLKHGIYVIDENALNKLESRKLKKLTTNGYMKLIYAHLFSLNNRY